MEPSTIWERITHDQDRVRAFGTSRSQRIATVGPLRWGHPFAIVVGILNTNSRPQLVDDARLMDGFEPLQSRRPMLWHHQMLNNRHVHMEAMWSALSICYRLGFLELRLLQETSSLIFEPPLQRRHFPFYSAQARRIRQAQFYIRNNIYIQVFVMLMPFLYEGAIMKVRVDIQWFSFSAEAPPG